MIRYLYILLLAAALISSSCAKKNPDFNRNDEGILVLPTEGICKADFNKFTHKYQFQYSPGTSYEMKISPRIGKNNIYYVFPEGNYKIVGVKYEEIPYSRLDFHGGKNIYKFNTPIYFQIKANKITIHDLLLQIIIENYRGNVERFRQYINYQPLNDVQRQDIIKEIKTFPNYRHMEIIDNNYRLKN